MTSSESSLNLIENNTNDDEQQIKIEQIKRTRQKLCIASVICASFVVVEFIGGYLSGSLAVVSDAMHLTTDLFAFLIAMAASHLALEPSTKEYAYGKRKIESLAALFSVTSLVLVTILLLYESILRFVTLIDLHNHYEHKNSLMETNKLINRNNTIDPLQGDLYNDLTSHENALFSSHSSSYGDQVIVNGSVMSLTAALGVLVNIILAVVLKDNHVHLPGATHSSILTEGGDEGDACACGAFHITKPKPNTEVAINKEELICQPVQSSTSSNRRSSLLGPMMFPSPPVAKETEMMVCKPILSSSRKNDGFINNKKSTTPSTNNNNKSVVSAFFSLKKDKSCLKYEKIDQFDKTNDEDFYDDENPSDEGNVQSLLFLPESKLERFNEEQQNKDKPNTPTNVNLDAAFLHALTDLAQSVMVLITGVIIWWHPHWHWLDPLLTFVFCIGVLYTSKPIFVRSISVLLDACPPNINYDDVLSSIKTSVKVSDRSIRDIKVCALRILGISDGTTGLVCHLIILSDNENRTKLKSNSNLRSVIRSLKGRFSSLDERYITIQMVHQKASTKEIVCPSCGPINNNDVLSDNATEIV